MKVTRFNQKLLSFVMMAFGLLILIVGLCGVILTGVEVVKPTLANRAAQTSFIGGGAILSVLGVIAIVSGVFGYTGARAECRHPDFHLTLAIALCVVVCACLLANSVVTVISGGFGALDYKDYVQFIVPLLFLITASIQRGKIQ